MLIEPFSHERCSIELRLSLPFWGDAPLGPAAVVCVVARDAVVPDHLVRQPSYAALVVTDARVPQLWPDVAVNCKNNEFIIDD